MFLCKAVGRRACGNCGKWYCLGCMLFYQIRMYHQYSLAYFRLSGGDKPLTQRRQTRTNAQWFNTDPNVADINNR